VLYRAWVFGGRGGGGPAAEPDEAVELSEVESREMTA